MSSTPSLQLYTSLVRTHLEYDTQVWDPFLIKKAGIGTEICVCCKSWDCSYSENLQQSLLPELSFRRKYLSLSYFYNLIYGHFEFPDMRATHYVNLPYSTRSSPASINAYKAGSGLGMYQTFAHYHENLVTSAPMERSVA